MKWYAKHINSMAIELNKKQYIKENFVGTVLSSEWKHRKRQINGREEKVFIQKKDRKSQRFRHWSTSVCCKTAIGWKRMFCKVFKQTQCRYAASNRYNMERVMNRKDHPTLSQYVWKGFDSCRTIWVTSNLNDIMASSYRESFFFLWS